MAAGSLTKASVVTPRARLVAEKLNRTQTTAFRSQQRETTKAGCLEGLGGGEERWMPHRQSCAAEAEDMMEPSHSSL